MSVPFMSCHSLTIVFFIKMSFKSNLKLFLKMPEDLMHVLIRNYTKSTQITKITINQLIN